MLDDGLASDDDWLSYHHQTAETRSCKEYVELSTQRSIEYTSNIFK